MIASYGFFLPHKGLLELIDAFALLHQRYSYVRLSLVNAQYPIDVSGRLIDEAKEKISALGLEKVIELHTDFLSDSQSLSLLQKADLTVFPYQETGESASGAVRYGLAAGKPVIVTPLAIFGDLEGLVHKLPGFDPAAIALGLENVMQAIADGTEMAKNIEEAANHWREAHLYPKLAKRLYGVMASA